MRNDERGYRSKRLLSRHEKSTKRRDKPDEAELTDVLRADTTFLWRLVKKRNYYPFSNYRDISGGTSTSSRANTARAERNAVLFND